MSFELALSTAPLASQAVIHGQIRADSSRAAILFAQVEVSAFNKWSQASISGLYAFDAVPVGRYRLAARAVGYAPLTIEVEVASNDTVNLDLLLAPTAVRLETLVATAKPTIYESGKMAEFNDRRRRGFGHFLDRIALARLEPAPISDALRRTTGITLIALPSPCFGFAAASGRGLGSSGRAPPECAGRPLPPYCFLTIVVDGVKVWEFGEERPPPDVSGLAAGELQAVEVYRGPAETPVEFNSTGNSCGVLVLWTRTGEEPR